MNVRWHWSVIIVVGSISFLSKASALDMKHLHGIVLAGGVGERLWPLSRKDHPKQFLKLGSERTLLQQSIDRLHIIMPPENIAIVTSKKHAEKVKNDVGHECGSIIIEPSARNTGPAILYSCLQIIKKKS